MALHACERMIGRVQRLGRRLGSACAKSTVESRVFDVYSLGNDLFLLQREPETLASARTRRRSMVLIERKDLRIGKRGWLCALGTGYFGTILTPLFTGALGKEFCRVPKANRSKVLAKRVVLANISGAVAELLQREADSSLGNGHRKRWPIQNDWGKSGVCAPASTRSLRCEKP